MIDMLRQTRAARILAADTLPGITADECYDFGDIMDFLWDNPDYVANRRGRGAVRPNILTEHGVKQLAGAWWAGRRKPTLKVPQTATDPAVETVLQSGFNFHKGSNTTKVVVSHHYFAMAAENIIGVMLERYLSQQLQKHGWIWCSGDIIKAVDFLKVNRTEEISEQWTLLQVKNRSNSENSSSMAIRNGTNIIKWHRLNATNGKTLWDKFPDPSVRGHLSEAGFQEYIKEQLG